MIYRSFRLFGDMVRGTQLFDIVLADSYFRSKLKWLWLATMPGKKTDPIRFCPFRVSPGREGPSNDMAYE